MRYSMVPVGLAVFWLLAAPICVSRAVADDAHTCGHGRGDDPIAACTQMIRHGSNSAATYFNRGEGYFAKGYYDRAIADFTEAIRRNPNDAVAYHDRGVVYHAKGDYDRAIADYTEAIRLNPKYATAYYNRGLARAAKGDTAKADIIKGASPKRSSWTRA